LADGIAEIVAADLNGQDGGDGVGGPGADLRGIWRDEFHEFAGEAESAAEFAAEFWSS